MTEGTVVTVNDSTTKRNHGYSITIQANDSLSIVYTHLSSISVEEGQSISVNTHIGYAGSTGYINHTGLGLYVHLRERKINPRKFFPQLKLLEQLSEVRTKSKE